MGIWYHVDGNFGHQFLPNFELRALNIRGLQLKGKKFDVCYVNPNDKAMEIRYRAFPMNKYKAAVLFILVDLKATIEIISQQK